MSRIIVMGVLALVSLCAGCSYETLDEAVCPPGGTELTYESFGRAFMERHCQGCHASFLEIRGGAPPSSTFDDVESIRDQAERIYARSAGANASMPPGPDDPPEDERADLAEWLACGAP